MADFKKLLSYMLTLPIRVLTKTKLVLANYEKLDGNNLNKPLFYVVKHDSASDLVVLDIACRKAGLPSPFSRVKLGDQKIKRYLCLDKLHPVISKKRGTTDAMALMELALELHQQHPELDAQLVPCFINWGRSPGRHSAKEQPLFDDFSKPSWLKKLYIVTFRGRDNFISIDDPVSLRYTVDQHGYDSSIARKLLRVARFHFQRRQLMMSGPRLWHRDQFITALMASPVIKKAIADEAKSKNISREQARTTARTYLEEMVADYRGGWIRFLDRVLTWVWNKLYSGLHIQNGEAVRKLAQEGHEIIYMPCHRSHMDYLLLTYVIYYQGLVPPHIAAGVNLDFWPMGGVFRRAGAFFMRRSFRGNKLYSEIFREYLAQLIFRGHSIKFYPESGRSRTGRLLKPKTGMLAMVIQTLFRGQDRPVTIVPVYIGYEHVMEVKTYLRELSGAKKKKESFLHLFSVLKNLRHFGRGYVNFGTPILLNKLLNEQNPDWKKEIHPYSPPKPSWLPNFINQVSHNVMCNINQAAALNGVTMTAMALTVANKNTLFRQDLEQFLSLLTDLQTDNAIFTNLSLPPEANPTELLENALKMEKFTLDTDSPDIIRLPQESTVEMTYYRNNIIHLYMIPSVIAAVLIEQQAVDKKYLLKLIEQTAPLLANEYFFSYQPAQLISYVEQNLVAMKSHGLIEIDGENIIAVDHAKAPYMQLHLLSLLVQETLQRYAAVLLTLERSSDGLSRSELERTGQATARYLAKMHDIKGPEFTDKSILSQFVGLLREKELIVIKTEGRYVPTLELKDLAANIYSLIDGDIFHTIKKASQRSDK
ncbi:glycerol-3-phosphate 1-O-acyltransferase PlsB [Gayadomonas joobiniege]|uniref:glycerol-3-phosphate 1-O-acyltransferase PlsB n=1 Tax=Gayadomonas joobiniege TaxID=1234606 RepID=UPI00036C5635|nr:glycerol-3-phosphate 1-O-acyltransferase PlsB [Gayadomonas joobiniege]